MNENAASLAALNVSLLQAIADGPVAGPSELAERAGLVPNNISRKLDALLAACLIEKTGEASCDVALTEAGERGLAAMAVWRGETPPVAMGGVSYIPLDRLVVWAGNPRKYIPPKSVADMAQSVADRGVETPITVRPSADGYEVLFGQRRFLGSQQAAKEGFIAADSLIACLVRDLSDAEAEEAAGVENLQREDMHWADLAQYFRHMMDDRKLSGPQLERMFGGKNYSARKIQDYAKIARELPSDVFALAYLPAHLDEAETKPNPQHLTYTKARDLVGEKTKERPALELSPTQALTLLEVIHAGLAQQGVQHLPLVGHVVATRFAKPHSGGPIHQLASDKKLMSFGFQGRDVVARTPLTEDVIRWLTQLGYDKSPGLALFGLQAKTVGDMQAAALANSNAYVTAELNPEPEPAPEAFLEAPAAEPAPADPTPETPSPAPAPDTLDDDASNETEDEILTPTIHQAPTPAAKPLTPSADEFDLPPMLAIVAIELAHKISTSGIERGPGTWAAEIRESWHRDGRVGQLVQTHRAMAALPLTRDKTVATLTARTLDWLASKYGIHAENGRPMMGDPALRGLQAEMKIPPEADGIYATYWLNGPAPAAAQPAGEPTLQDSPADAPPSAPRRDVFMQQILDVTAEARALGRVVAALREARTALRTATTRKLTTQEAAKLDSLIDSAIAQAEAATPAPAGEPADA